MKILIDGYNLGLRQGTGIATYGRELSNLLTKNGHDVGCFYEFAGLNYQRDTWPQFIQHLNVTPHFGPWEKMINVMLRLPDYKAYLSRKALMLKSIPKDTSIINSMPERLPRLNAVYNADHLFKFSIAMNRLHGRNTLITDDDQKYDVMHLTSPLPIKLRKRAKIVTIHDIVPIVAPDTTAVKIKTYRNLIKHSIADADDICVVSQRTKTDLLNHFDVGEEKIHVTYQSVTIPAHLKNLDPDYLNRYLKTNFNLEYKKFFLFYGAIEPKKNIRRLLEAYSLSKSKYPLVIVGKDGWLSEDVHLFYNNLNTHTFRRFMRIKYLPFRNLMMLLQSATGLIFPSIYEGFGLPVLEAMEMGVPVISSNSSSLPEVGGDAVCYVDPFDVEGMAKCIDRFAEDPAYCNDLVQRGHDQAKKFSADQHYKNLMRVYQRYG